MENYFKAIFELLICEGLDPNICFKFKIFRSKLEIEKDLMNLKDTKKLQIIDVTHTYEYEHLYSQYLLYEY